MSQSPVAPVTTRRSFLDLLLAAVSLTWVASVIYPVLRYLKPLPAAGPSGPTTLTPAETEKLDRESFVIVPAAAARVLVVRDSSAALHAVDARCTHEGCTVRFLASDAVIWCACHNARFDLEGRVLSGPPPRPLPRYLVERTESGDVVIRAKA
jgi:cytochrome b6-f complex iron-sulfur subunit